MEGAGIWLGKRGKRSNSRREGPSWGGQGQATGRYRIWVEEDGGKEKVIPGENKDLTRGRWAEGTRETVGRGWARPYSGAKIRADVRSWAPHVAQGVH